MKKNIKLILVIIFIIIAGILVLFANNNKHEYYIVEYLASYNTYNVLDSTKKYEVIETKRDFSSVVSKIENLKSYQKIFTNNFFKDKSLLIVEAGINTEIANFKYSGKNIDLTIYCDSPLTTVDQNYKYDLYIIPVSKDLEDINVEILSNPDKLF